MDSELEEIKRKKLEKLKKQYMNGGKKMIVIDCWAPWCGPCRMVGPVIEELANEMQGKIVFGKLNVDENPATSAKHQIMSIPTMLVFKNGNLVDRLIGALPKEELQKKLEPYQ